MDIKEGNKLIAEFMDETWGLDMEECRYHVSWDCLMPCVERIEHMIEVNKVGNPKIGYYYLGQGRLHMMDQNGEVMLKVDPDSDMKRIDRNWICCVEFIKWHNDYFTNNPE